jgi:hypothetical protein
MSSLTGGISPALEGRLVEATYRDPVNITVYGNPVLDTIVNVGEGAAHLAELDAIEKVAAIRKNGNLEFRADSYVAFTLHDETVLWGPFNPKGQEDRYVVGQKYKMPIRTTTAMPMLQPGGLYRLPAPWLKRGSAEEFVDAAVLPCPYVRIGGGGANVLFGFYDVFAQLRVELVGTVESRLENRPGRMDRFIKPLTDRIGVYTEVFLYDQPGINLSVEGLGYERDRIIFTAELPDHEEFLDSFPVPNGRAIMVNTVYSSQVAIDAMCHACSPTRLGLLALTKSLCSKTRLDPSLIGRVLSRHNDLAVPKDCEFKSMHDFITRYVLPNGRCVVVMNEDELDHLTGVSGSIQRGESKVPTLGGLIQGLRAVRVFQAGAKDRVYVTAGASGSIVLDEHDDICYCGTVDDSTRPSTGKTAIGDTYATFLLALETIGNYIRAYNIPARDVVKAAAAGADAGVYYGFGRLAVNKVNNYLGERKRRLVSLGRLDAFPCDDWKNVGIPEMRSAEWDSLVRRNYIDGDSENSFAPGTLQEVLGRAFLRI